ncbi:nucleotide pyrophosphohydrolase [Salegentibacter maritimus]|uniref:Nucleotide pyrophosphohydrolase n=1 Tax=Salegentibacter maritimus TaxID=2794347 RepID=A0ABS0TIL6_9FLAO|nr:nucleotide pyrophosphohydrolase [Salegentibacter maritimus]MBI6120898.1 nucleotide pyrophosphohydrolase [Salegentibacter maritimus]
MNRSFTELQKKILKFRKERNWRQFHSVKDLAIGLNVEVSELQELILWKTDQQIRNIENEKIANELADIFIFLTYFSEEFKIDLLDAVSKKLEINEIKYPVEKSKDSNKKYDEL